MYSLLPALVSGLFFSYGIYVLSAKGFNRTSIVFFLHCITTFFWQGTWAVLFQVRDPELAIFLIKFGYLFILFLPTTLYHFLAVITGRQDDIKWVYFSYGLGLVLAGFNVASNLFVSGYYEYPWGYYPKGGLLHPIHVLQTTFVIFRGLYITWEQKNKSVSSQRISLQICFVSMLIYSFAAIDYLCNYGVSIYPSGSIFTAISLALLSIAITRYDLISGLSIAATVAATIAHEMRTPLSTISLHAFAIEQHLPHIYEGYRRAVANGLIEPQIDASIGEKIVKIPEKINHQINHSNTMINMMLASVRMEYLNSIDFAWHSIDRCTREALDTYPFTAQERAKVNLQIDKNFQFYGSESLFIFVIFNLLKNSLYAIKAANKGDINITISVEENNCVLRFKDTASGISPSVLKKIFNTFYTTKQTAGAGIGLAFCRRVIQSFGGSMQCESIEGQYTTFILSFAATSLPKDAKHYSLINEVT